MPNSQAPFARAWMNPAVWEWLACCAPHLWPPASIIFSKNCHRKLCTCCAEPSTWKPSRARSSNAHPPSMPTHKYSKVETSIRMRPLNSLALNEPNRFWSKNFGLCNPRSWAHKRRCCLPLDNLNHALQVSNLILADATVKPPPYLWYTLQCWEQRKLKNNKIARLWTSGSISTRTLVGRLAVGFRVEEN